MTPEDLQYYWFTGIWITFLFLLIYLKPRLNIGALALISAASVMWLLTIPILIVDRIIKAVRAHNLRKKYL